MKQTTLRISEKDKAFLDGLGGVSKGIRLLIEEKRKKMEGEELQKTPEEKFFESILLPEDTRGRDTYKAFLALFIKNNARKGSLDFYVPKLAGMVGYDEKTVRKHFRKLEAAGYVKSYGMLFAPTIRVSEDMDVEVVKNTFKEYLMFLKSKGVYQDIGVDIWG